MKGLHWRIVGTVLGGAVVGLLVGQTTIAGIASPPPRTLIGRPLGYAPGAADETGDGAAPVVASGSTIEEARIVNACDDCSDYDLGFRFAAARRVRDSAECGEFSWSYQRGCLAWAAAGSGGLRRGAVRPRAARPATG